MSHPVLYIGGMNHDPAIGAGRIFEVQVKDKIVIGLFTPYLFILRSHQDTLRYTPYSFRKNSVGQVVIEKGNPTLAGSMRVKIFRLLGGRLQAPAAKQ